MPLYIDIKVAPLSGKNGWKLDAQGQLKCYLKSPPEKGKANNELIDLLSKALKIPKNKISISHGMTSKKKQICIDSEINRGQLLHALGIEQQMPLF